MTKHRAAWLAVVCWLLSGAVGARAAESDPDVIYAERTLREAGAKTDGPGLVAFFKARALSEADRERLAATVRLLGHNSFHEREKASRDLVTGGRASLPYLRAALKDPDLEIARRAERCLETIDDVPFVAQLTAAARLMADRRPDGAAEALLAYLPSAEDEAVEESVLVALAVVGLRDGKPEAAVAAALTDKEPLRRAGAAYVLGRATATEDRRPLARLLNDGDARVRHQAAASLVRSGDKAGVPALTALLSDAPMPVAWQVEELLCRLAGDQAPLAGLGAGGDAERRKCRDAWEAWWKANAGRLDLAKLAKDEPLLGLTLVCEYDGAEGGRVWEGGRDGKVRWEIKGLAGPNDAQLLPGGRVLVAERNASKVTERDRSGKILWQFATQASPVSCQRLPGGNTLIATFNELFEVTPDGKKVFTHAVPSGFRHATRLRTGHVVYVGSSGEIGELDAAGKLVRTITPAAHAHGAGYWASVEALPNGQFLVVFGGAGKVVEIDATGKIGWECSLSSPVFATRLRGGNTLVASFEGRCLIEVDRSGKEVSRQTLQGRPFTARRY
jgi:HEAT repeat protein